MFDYLSNKNRPFERMLFFPIITIFYDIIFWGAEIVSILSRENFSPPWGEGLTFLISFLPTYYIFFWCWLFCKKQELSRVHPLTIFAFCGKWTFGAQAHECALRS